MSEDKTEVLGNEEPTEELEAQKAPTTNPMLEAILARMNEGFAEINQRFDGIDKRFDGVDKRFDGVENELREQRKAIHSLERRFDVYTQDLLKMRGDVLNHESRIEDLERKAS
jgi:archaellum component FlaC